MSHIFLFLEIFAQEGGIQHLLQLWVNLPREKKLCPPKYQSITQDQIP
ncbi:MAG: hypothetical protein RLZZ143_3255, partial [Cyanobacteriota bacterium]